MEVIDLLFQIFFFKFEIMIVLVVRLRKCIGGSLGDPGCPWEHIHEGRACNGKGCLGRSLGDGNSLKVEFIFLHRE